MKSSIVIALIVVGTTLIVSPLLFGYLIEARVADLLAQGTGSGIPNYNAHINSWPPVGYIWGCFLVGVSVLWTGIAEARKADTTRLTILPHTSA